VPNAFVRKLSSFEPLNVDDQNWLVSVSSKTKGVAAGSALIREGDNPENVIMILDGFAMRYKTTFEGRRQIFAYFVPGDFCDLHVAMLKTMDHSIATLSACRVAYLSPGIIHELTERRPSLTRALWMCSLVDEATLREWLVNLGQRSAPQRISHLFCELHERMMAVSLADDGSFELPLTQVELADTMGLSVVHVNRSLKELREAGLVSHRDRRIMIPNVSRLKEYSDFDPSYLHLRWKLPSDHTPKG